MDSNMMLAQAQRWLNLGNPHQALEALRRVLAEEPDLAEAHAMLAIVLLRQRRPYGAEVEAKMALTLEPESWLSHHVMALVSFARRRYSGAIQHYEQACALAPDAAEPRRGLAEVLWTLGKRKRAHQLIDEALALEPDEPDILSTKAHFLVRQNRTDEAERVVREALAVDAEHADSVVMMGHILLHRGNVGEARQHAVVVLQNDPTDEGALRLIAAIKARQNPLLGVWWRYNTWLSGMGQRAILVLLGAFFSYRLFRAHAILNRWDMALDAVGWAWLAACLYTWIGPALFARAVRKEIDEVELDSEF